MPWSVDQEERSYITEWGLFMPLGRNTRCDKSLRHVAATGCCNKSPRVTCENHCRCDLSHKFKLVWICATYRSDKLSASDLSQQQFRRGDLSPRRVAAICRIVCLGLNLGAATGKALSPWVFRRTAGFFWCECSVICYSISKWSWQQCHGVVPTEGVWDRVPHQEQHER